MRGPGTWPAASEAFLPTAALLESTHSGRSATEPRPVVHFYRARHCVHEPALLGQVRAAVLEDADFLVSQQFEDELVLLSRTYASAACGRLSD